MRDLFPKDRLRRFLMALFLVLAIIELSRGSFIWVAVDIIFAASFSPQSADLGSISVVPNF